MVEAIDTLLASVARAYTGPAASAPPVPELEALRRAGIPLVGDDACRRALADDEQRRRLLRLVATSGWSWEGVRRAGTAAAGPDCSAPPPAA